MKANWWKILAVVLVLYAIIGGMLMKAPELPILHETIRNLHYHVTMWFTMMSLMTASVVYSIKCLSGFELKNDIRAKAFAEVGMLAGVLGLTTGSLWAKFTWGAFWVSDPKLNGAAITALIYLAYFILRNSLDDDQKRARTAAVYNIFAFVILVVFLMILPRMPGIDSLHPGNGGNAPFSDLEVDNELRKVFYPAMLGWILLGFWIAQIRFRLGKIEYQLNNK